MHKSSSAGLYAAVLAIAFVGFLTLGTPLPTLAGLILVVVCPLMLIVMVHGMNGGEPVGRRPGHAPDPHHRFSSSQGSE